MHTASRPLRICHVAYSFYESDNRVIRYAETLAARGDTVDVIALRRDDSPRRSVSNGVSVLGIQTRARNERAAWRYLVKVLWFFAKTFVLLAARSLRRRYDVVHVHNMPDFLVFVAVVPRLRGARVILDIHDLVPELYAGKFGTADSSGLVKGLLASERRSCHFADHVIVANHLWLPRLEERSTIRGKCTALINYPDLQLFDGRRDGVHHPSSGFILLYPGTLNHHQGMDLAIEAFALAVQHMPPAEFHVYGDGPALDDLKVLARARGIAGRVRFMARVPLHEIPDVMASASVGVVPKRADGFGNEAFSTKILEFMASGVPVIVSRTRVDAHYFDDSVVRFFTPGDVDDLAQQMRWVYEHPAERAAMATRAGRLATDYAWSNHQGAYTAIIDGLTSEGSRADGAAGGWSSRAAR